MKTRLIGAILSLVLAVVGTVVLTGYVRGADARAAAGAELVDVYVVKETIPAGTTIADAASLITKTEIQASGAAKGRVEKMSSLTGKVADVALVPGEQLLESRWVEPAKRAAKGAVTVPAGMQSVTIALPVEHAVGGTIRPGDKVGVIVSARLIPEGDREIPLTREVLHKVLVTAVQHGTSAQTGEKTADPDAKEKPVTDIMVTLALKTPDLEKLVWGKEFGSIWLALEPDEADQSGSSAVDGGAVFR